MRKLILAAATLSFVALSAHAQLGDILRRVNPNQIRKGANMARQVTHEFTEAEEADIGRVVAARILATYPMAKNQKLQKYVTLVGDTVASYSTRPTLEWHFAVLDSPIVNAISAPGGFVFITTGALQQMHSEAELASVLGHEVGHVTQKHILNEIKRGNVISAGVDFAQTTASGSFLNNDMSERIGKLAYDKLFTTGLGRKDENEADKIGTQLADLAGYRAGDFLTFLTALQQLEGTTALKTLTATHPSPEDRIAALRPTLHDSTKGVQLAERFGEWTGKS